MAVTIRPVGNHAPGLELQPPSTPIDPALFSIKTLTSTQMVGSVTISGQVIDFTYSGTIDLSPLGGVTPKNYAEASQYTIPNSISSFTIGSGGITYFTETFSPASTFTRIGDLLDSGTKMITELAGNDAYYAALDATGSNNDTVYLYGGNDTYYVNHPLLTKVDLFFGGDGIDTAVFNQKSSNFTIAPTNFVWNYATQKSELPGFSVTDKTKTFNTLYVNQVERLKFLVADPLTGANAVALDNGPTDNAGSVYMLYKAAFNRAPDASGMGYWLSLKDGGSNIVTNIAQGFVASKEFTDKYGTNPSNASYVDKLYQNVLNRAGDSGGVTYWNQELDAGRISKAAVLVQFATLAEGAANVASLIANGIPYTEFVS